MPRFDSPRSPMAPWPEPDAEALEHSRRMVGQIERAIAQAGGWIGFRTFMDLVLYAPGLGYYAAGTQKFGPAGDFVTAPEISPLFSRCLARQCAQVLRALGGGDLLELGAGTGTMAADLLAELDRLGLCPERYLILEPSPQLRQRQRETLETRLPHLADRVQWLESLPEEPIRGVVLANEVVDAMPVRCFALREHGVMERGVSLTAAGLGWAEREADAELRARVEGLLGSLPERLPQGYQTELNPDIGPWLRSIAGIIESGAVVLIDYGYPRCEYYAPERVEGTLLCHYRHRVHDDPFLWPGLQDITASVDFTAVAEAAVAAGFVVDGFTTQASFLIANGLEDLYQAALDARPEHVYELSQQVQRLTLPGEMGERFHAIALTRGLDLALSGFRLRDFAHRL